MAERSGFFDAHLTGGEYDRVYLASSFARYFASFIGNGVFAEKSEGLMVYQTDPAHMGVKVLPGQAWINGYWYENDGEFLLPVDTADGVLNRIDLIVLRWGTVERSINLVVKKGTPAANAVAPVVQRDSDYYELKLAEIRVMAGTVGISQANIVDTRTDTSVCGWVTGVIKQADTSQLFAQWQAAYEAAYAQWQAAYEASHNQWQAAYEEEYAKAQGYYVEQKDAWERFFANATEDSVFPVPSLDDVGKIPVINGASDGYELKDVLTLLGLNLLGTIAMNGNRITGLPLPESGSEPATKEFVENFTVEGSTYVATDDNKDGNIVLRPYVADADELEFRDHIKNKENPHGVTPAQIGAAPSGYGLGDAATNLPLTVDANNCAISGWYRINSSTANGIGANAVMRVEAFNSKSITQTAYSGMHTGGVMVIKQRNKIDTVWQSWVDVSPSAFAPAGYGLGGVGKWVNSRNEITASGFYCLGGAGSPDAIDWFGYASMYSAESGYLIISRWDGCMARSQRGSSGWGEWEWLNPPMVPGMEYRTTERWNNGKSVWTQLIDFGALPNNTQKTKSCASFTQVCDSVCNITDGTYYSNANKEPWVTGFNVSSGQILLKTNVDVSAYTATVQLWYVKD